MSQGSVHDLFFSARISVPPNTRVPHFTAARQEASRRHFSLSQESARPRTGPLTPLRSYRHVYFVMVNTLRRPRELWEETGLHAVDVSAPSDWRRCRKSLRLMRKLR